MVDVISTYGIKVTALQEIRWKDTEQLKIGKYIIFYSEIENRHHFRSGFAVHESLEPHTASERILELIQHL